jgi:hypothetical protein
MASAGNVTITLRAKDEISPVIQRVRLNLWLLQHPRFVIGTTAAGWAAFGFVAGALLNALGWHI